MQEKGCGDGGDDGVGKDCKEQKRKKWREKRDGEGGVWRRQDARGKKDVEKEAWWRGWWR